MPKIKPRSSRRVPPLKDSDYDHEIKLVDHSITDLGSPSGENEALRQSTSENRVVAGPSSSRRNSLPTEDTVDVQRSTTIEPLIDVEGELWIPY